jgi:alpha-beta hydrolase superfamily lysophospholipase
MPNVTKTPACGLSITTLLIGALACYALLTLAAYLLQDRFLYFPFLTTRAQAAQAAARRGLALWPEGEDDYYGLVSVDPPDPSRGTILVWHGNGGAAEDRLYYIQPLQALGFRVILLEYPGYGARPGRTSEASFVADARQAARRAADEFGGPLYVWGESLGCGIAAAVAADPDLEVQGAVMLTPWDRLPDLAQRLYWYLPTRWLVRDQYDNVQNLRAYQAQAAPGLHPRVAVLMATRDEIIPNAHTMRLYDSLQGEKRLWRFEGAGHNSWPMSPDAPWWAEVMEWIGEPAAHLGSSPEEDGDMTARLSVDELRARGFDWPKYALIEEHCVVQEGQVDLDATVEKLQSSRAYYRRQLTQAFNFRQQTGADYSDISDRYDDDARMERDLGAAIAYLQEIIQSL